jgi:hypothetical protein
MFLSQVQCFLEGLDKDPLLITRILRLEWLSNVQLSDLLYGPMIPQEFYHSVKPDKAHYTDLKDDKHISSWSCGFVAKASLHHTHLVLDENIFQQQQTILKFFKKFKLSCMLLSWRNA